MADYTSKKKIAGLDILTAVDDADYLVFGDSSDAGKAKAITKKNLLGTQIKSMVFTMPLSGITDDIFYWLGAEEEKASGLTTDYTTDFSLHNQHLGIIVNSITTGGDIVITGTSLSEITGVPVIADTETITVDTTAGQHYQTDKKWFEITNVDVTSGTIVGITYSLHAFGYFDFGNTDWELLGYRADMRTQGATSDLAIVMTKVQDDGGKKHSHVALENYGHDSTVSDGAFYDGLRTGANDRSYTFSTTLAPDDSMISYKCLDFSTYFTNDENIFEGAKNEGLILRLEGKPSGGITQIDYITLTLFYRN